MVKFILIILLFIPLSGCDDQEVSKVDRPLFQEITNETQSGQIYEFQVELALTPQEQATGLMFRESMKDDHGMLFYFGQERHAGFWMKNTLIPLDMIFIRYDGVIHHIHENAIPNDLTSITSQGLVLGVLEINGGLSQKLGISTGDKVKHQLFERNRAQ